MNQSQRMELIAKITVDPSGAVTGAATAKKAIGEVGEAATKANAKVAASSKKVETAHVSTGKAAKASGGQLKESAYAALDAANIMSSSITNDLYLMQAQYRETAQAAQQFAGMAADMGMSKTAVGLTALGTALAVTGIAMYTMGENTKQVNEYLDEMVTKTVEGAKTIGEAYDLLAKKKAEALPNNRDVDYSGGLVSDVGAATKNILDVGGWFDRSDDNSKARKRIEEEQKKLLKEWAAAQKEALKKITEDIDNGLNEYEMTIARGKDAIKDGLKDWQVAEQQGYDSMLNPFTLFRERQQVGFDEMLSNMQQNNEDLLIWKNNLKVLMESGNSDLASYFATLGPQSAQSLSDMLQGGQTSMDAFREQMVTGFTLTGQDSQEAYWQGLSQIPDLAGEMGTDVLGHLYRLQIAAADPAVQLTEEYKQAFKIIKEDALENITALYAGTEMGSQATKDEIAALATAFGNLDPELLVGAGLTPEALGIPQVQKRLGELAQQGVKDPLTIATNIEELLSGITDYKDHIDELVHPASPMALQIQTTDAMLAIEQVTTMLGDIPLNYTMTFTTVANGRPFKVQVSPDGTVSIPGMNVTLFGQEVPLVTKREDGGYTNFNKLPDSARIQSPGTLVQWAEPNTGGEAFIPMSPSKRKQSIEIWKQVGAQFMQFDNGGMRMPGEGSQAETGSLPAGSKYSPMVTRTGPKPQSGGGGGGMSEWDLYQRMYETGAVTDNQMLEAAKARMASAKEYSDVWMGAWRVVQSTGDAIARKADEIAADQQAIIDHQRMIEDNMFQVGDANRGDYLKILEDRMAGLEKYSDEWTYLWQQIQGINDSIAQDAEYQAQVFTDLGASIKDAFQSIYDSVADPMKAATSLVSAFGSETYIQFDQLLGFYDNVTEASKQWQDSLAKLNSMGLNQDTYDQLAQSGPQALELAQAIISSGQAGIDQLNAAAAGVAAIITDTGTAYASDAPVTQTGTTISIGDISIDLSGTGTLTEEQITTMLQDAFDALVESLTTAVGG